MSTKPDQPKRRAFVPRPPRSAEERLPKLYRALTDQVDDGHLQNAIKTCKKIMSLDASSQAAFQTLLFLYLQTDEYTSALALLDAPPSTAESLDFERAYCLYRLHREKEALSTLDVLKTRGKKVDQLEAQIRYRLGEYQRAHEIYEDLLADCDSSSPEHPDILTNLNATTSHIDFTQHGYRSHVASSSGADESNVPSLPAGWSSGGVLDAKAKKPASAPGVAAATGSKSAAPVSKGRKEGKTRHKLPKGAVAGKAFTEDPERWMPLRQRASYLATQNKKKGGKESMGTGFTQGSTSSGSANPSSSGGGNKGKKGKKK
ncbi:hypothetical protein IAU60_002130 [Kwoniella sp. DSM 27419]